MITRLGGTDLGPFYYYLLLPHWQLSFACAIHSGMGHSISDKLVCNGDGPGLMSYEHDQNILGEHSLPAMLSILLIFCSDG